MRTTRKLLAFASALCLLGVGAYGQAAAETAAKFYKGKTITAYSEFAEDAVMTVFSRIMAPYVEKYTGANVIVKPMPGGGGMLARNHLYGAKPDGLNVILVGHGPKLITGGLFDLQGVRYEWSEFVPLGKVIEANVCVIVAKDSPWNDPKDPATEAFNYGESSPFFGPLFAEALGWEKMTVIPGYRSTTGRAVAISRGEIQAATTSSQTIVANPDLVKALVFALPEEAFPNVPSVVKTVAPGRKEWADYIAGWSEVQFMALAPPGTPEDRAAFLEGALKKSWADPEFHEALAKVKHKVSAEFVTAEKLTAFMKSLAALSSEEVSEMKHVITAKYKKK